jgi:hypothetical protein
LELGLKADIIRGILKLTYEATLDGYICFSGPNSDGTDTLYKSLTISELKLILVGKKTEQVFKQTVNLSMATEVRRIEEDKS